MRLKGPAVALSTLAETLTVFTDEPVVDQTDLLGRYDIDFVFMPEERLRMHAAPGGGGGLSRGAEAQVERPPALFEAVQQYGLKLETRKAPMKVLIVDHLEKSTSEN